MSSVNKAIVVGYLGRDPEVRYTPGGTAVANVSIATSRSWKNKEGEKQEETEWHRVIFYDKLAEIAGEYLQKGKLVYVEGRLKTRKWQDKDGNDKYTTEIIASEMHMLGKREGGGAHGGDDAEADRQRERSQQRAAATAQRPATKPAPTGFSDMDDDIPF